MLKLKDLTDMIAKYEENEVSATDFSKFIKENIEIKHYLPVSGKRTLFQDVFAQLENTDFHGDFLQQSLMTEVVFKLCTLFAYSNISMPKVLNEVLYNKLCRTGVLEYVLNSIGYDYIELKDSFNRMFIYSSFLGLKDAIAPKDLEKMQSMVNEITSTLRDGEGLETLKKLVSGSD